MTLPPLRLRALHAGVLKSIHIAQPCDDFKVSSPINRPRISLMGTDTYPCLYPCNPWLTLPWVAALRRDAIHAAPTPMNILPPTLPFSRLPANHANRREFRGENARAGWTLRTTVKDETRGMFPGSAREAVFLIFEREQ